MEKFGDWLKEVMADRDLEQADLVRLTGKPSATVSRWVNGNDIPSPPSCELIASALHVPVDEVLSRAGHRPKSSAKSPTQSVSQELEAEGRRLIVAARKVAEIERQYRLPDAARLRHVGPANAHELPRDVAGAPDEDRFTLDVLGDCLEPDIHIGDILKMSASRLARAGDIVSFIADGTRQVKRVEERDGQLCLVSKYGPIVPLTSVQIEGVMLKRYPGSE